MLFEQDGERIDDLKFIISKIAEVTTVFDLDGVSIRFMNSNVHAEGIRTAAQVEEIVSRVHWAGLTPLGTQFAAKIVQPFVIKPATMGTLPKPVLAIIITDGEPTREPHDTLRTVIREAKDALLHTLYGSGALAIQIGQVGTDLKAQSFLASLDNDPIVGNMIDCTGNFELESEKFEQMQLQLTPEMWLLKLTMSEQADTARDSHGSLVTHEQIESLVASTLGMTLNSRIERHELAAPKAVQPQQSRFAGCNDIVDMMERLPEELYEMIDQYKDPYTKYLHNELPLPLCWSDFESLMCGVFKSNRLSIAEKMLADKMFWPTYEAQYVTTPEMEEIARPFFFNSGSDCFTTMDLQQGKECSLSHLHKLACEEPRLNSIQLQMANEMLDWILLHGKQPFTPSFASELLDIAAGLGRLQVVKHLLPQLDGEPSNQAFDAAGLRGHSQVIDFFIDNNLVQNASIEGAVVGGLLSVVKRLFSMFTDRFTVYYYTVSKTIESGNTKVIEWMMDDAEMSRGAAFDSIRYYCALHGKLDLLKLATERQIGNPLEDWTLNSIATNGHLDVLIWLHQHTDLPFTGGIVDGAAFEGQIHVAKWFRSNFTLNCSSDAFFNAGSNGHVEMFIWLWDNYPAVRPSANDFSYNIANHFWILDTIRQRTSDDLSYLLSEIIGTANFPMAELLLELGFAELSANMMDNICLFRSTDGIRWLHERIKGQYDPELIVLACARDRFETAKCLVDECGVQVTDRAFRKA
eukprot:jgi/Hompol1/2355/HPOL_005967-RA